ncbi:hypothetical protein [Granulicella tundricola]|uniref:Lipoprotein n=1 Tax=Granulicella tundricola (strain ATCC BAA-1859 / DSM 23138 / MP5ACTX9) TaxID=1198114 RepID=E8WZL6_GRATM|nr:hypothetical protein [Granulicella tundricola]ADW69990.1 hypothetical protein AciX9_2967 [Granulicella tundricola MP5ACTX9]
MRPTSFLLPLALLPLLTGCRSIPDASSAPNATAEQRAQFNDIRQQLDEIPPPSKTRYMAVKTLTSWENPYLTIQGQMVTLHVTIADANPSQFGNGGLLRPVGARRQDLNVRTSDLAAALNAVPTTAWPYGRVIAVEEAHDIPAAAKPEVRRNMEVAMKTINDLGIVLYEWQEGGASLR